MSELSDKIAYMKGLCSGLNVEADTPEHKLLLAMMDALEAMGAELKALRADHEELSEYVDVIDDDLGEIENEIFDDDEEFELEEDEDGDEDECEDDCDDACFTIVDGDECGDDCEDGGCHCGHEHHEHGFSEAMLDQPLTERPCPACGKPISISMRALLNKDDPIVCPHCGGKFRAQEHDDE